MTSALLQTLWKRCRSPEFLLLAANLLARLLGFWVSMLVSRVAGVQALGAYSGLLITTASPTTPVAAVLGNNATLMASRHQGRVSMGELVLAHAPVLLVSGVVAWSGCVGLMALSGLHTVGNWPVLGLAVVLTGLVLGQLVTPFVMGLAHGVNRSGLVAVVTMAVSALALLTSFAVVQWFGLAGALTQATLVGVLPALIVVAWLWRHRGVMAVADQSGDALGLRQEAWAQFRQALPNVGATVLNNATNWLSCIYLAERSHGAAGLGLVAIGLQFSALMLLPLTSWGGRVMRSLSLAHASGLAALRREVSAQVRRCVAVSAGVSLLVALASPWIAQLYKVDERALGSLMAINAVGATVFAVTFVYERASFCLGAQRPWLMASVLAYACQLLVTAMFIEQGVWVVALGNVSAIVVLMGVFRGYLGRVWGRSLPLDERQT